jgi:hypothetical protein
MPLDLRWQQTLQWRGFEGMNAGSSRYSGDSDDPFPHFRVIAKLDFVWKRSPAPEKESVNHDWCSF